MSKTTWWRCKGCGYIHHFNPIGLWGNTCPNSLDCRSRTYEEVVE